MCRCPTFLLPGPLGICSDTVGSAKLLGLVLILGAVIKGITIFNGLQPLQRNIEKRGQETVEQLRNVLLIIPVQRKQPISQRFIGRWIPCEHVERTCKPREQ